MPQSLDPFVKAEPAGKPTDSDSIINLFNDNDDVKEVKKEEVKAKETIKEDDKSDKEEEIKLKEEDDIKPLEENEEDDKPEIDEDEDTEIEVKAPPRIKEIEAKYPKIFKEFPFLSKMMARDKQYTELFGSFDEAKEVHSKVERLNEFESQLLSGSTVEILQTVKNTDPKAFDKIVDNYLQVLETIDKDAYYDVIGNFSKRVVIGMVNEAKRSSNEDLSKSAEEFYKYLFGTTEWQDPKVRSKDEAAPQNKQLENERLQFVQERFEVARDDLQNKVDNVLKSTIEEYIDPNGKMSAYEKKNAIKEALEQVAEAIRKDDLYMKKLNKLWKASFDDKFSKASLDKIRSSCLGRAKGSLSGIIKKVRAEALKDKDDNRDDKKEEKEETTPRLRKNPINAGRPTQQINKAKTERQKGESVEDFFARD